MRPWLNYSLLVLAGLLLGLGAYLAEVAVTASAPAIAARCWTALLADRGWTATTPTAEAVDGLRHQAARDDPAFAAQFLFNTSEEVAAAYGAYATCVATDPS